MCFLGLAIHGITYSDFEIQDCTVKQKKTVRLLLLRYLWFLLTNVYNFFAIPIRNDQPMHVYKICHLILIAILHYLTKNSVLNINISYAFLQRSLESLSTSVTQTKS